MGIFDDSLDIEYDYVAGSLFANANEQILQECSELYSNHYGKWGANAKNCGENVKLGISSLKKWISKDHTAIYYARFQGKLIGYVIAVRRKNGCGTLSWITQLVVHTDYRNKTVAKRLLQYVWGISGDYAWGIVSANPYAVRALERVTHRKCNPDRIKKDKGKILKIGKEYVPYINEEPEVCIGDNESLIDTKFSIDHSEVPSMLENVKKKTSWKLGELREGWEWLAFTFRDQQAEYSEQDEEVFLSQSDKSVKDAYSRMDLTSEKQHWMRHTKYEADFIIKECCLTKNSTILDLGCGTGRHSFELSKRGLNVVAVDYLDNHFKKFQATQIEDGTKPSFICRDCRNLESLPIFDSIICLYDVIGSYTDKDNNQKILEQIFGHLKPGGFSLISVMNFNILDASVSEYSFEKLMRCESSQTMETTGDVFDTNYLFADKKERIVYRKETFERGNLQPIELLVRDKRFSKDEITQLCKDVGFQIEFARYVKAGDWEDSPLINTEKNVKEILIKCRKPYHLN